MADLACLCVNVALRQGPAPALQVAHALPSKEARAGKPVLQLHDTHIEMGEGLLPDLFLPCNSTQVQALFVCGKTICKTIDFIC